MILLPMKITNMRIALLILTPQPADYCSDREGLSARGVLVVAYHNPCTV